MGTCRLRASRVTLPGSPPRRPASLPPLAPLAARRPTVILGRPVHPPRALAPPAAAAASPHGREGGASSPAALDTCPRVHARRRPAPGPAYRTGSHLAPRRKRAFPSPRRVGAQAPLPPPRPRRRCWVCSTASGWSWRRPRPASPPSSGSRTPPSRLSRPAPGVCQHGRATGDGGLCVFRQPRGSGPAPGAGHEAPRARELEEGEGAK